MPTYLVHGFRWPRALIRIHIILQNLDDAAAEWLVAPDTTRTLLHNFQELLPNHVKSLPSLRFVEQYDADDDNAVSQPFAYVAGLCEELRLGISLEETVAMQLEPERLNAISALRDRLAPDEKVGWFVVVCGDEERWAPP
ncbi:hypothetical protein K470DRAFT_208155, partial [Piedraia hortae CBS 480.64]